MGVVVLTWYGRQGGSWGGAAAPVLAPIKAVRVTPLPSANQDGGNYAVECFVMGADTVRVCGVNVVNGLPAAEELSRLDSGTTVAPVVVYPFADTIRAALLVFDGITVLVCDSSIFAPRAAGERSPFWERLDLIVIPPAGEDLVLRAREQFRPRFLAVIPPCATVDSPNIVCGADEYEFRVVRGGLEIIP